MAFASNRCGDFLYYTVPAFTETGLVHHGFTTRLGGVSAPPLDRMNLGIGRGDDPAAVRENYAIAGRAIGFPPERLVFFPQVHGSDIFVAGEQDAGMGFRAARPEFDGIITNEKNLPLATFHADCTPIFLLDPVRGVAGVVHAGWRGTAQRAAGCAVAKMQEVIACRPQDILAGIGPCGRSCCYETDQDVPDAMRAALGEDAGVHMHCAGAKWRVDLAGLNRLVLLQSGVQAEHITMSELCTCCQPDVFWSHRRTGGVRGAMAAIIMLV